MDNLAALIDDPSNPRFHRLTLMATTTTAPTAIKAVEQKTVGDGTQGDGDGADGDGEYGGSPAADGAPGGAAGGPDAVESALQQREAVLTQRLATVNDRLLEQNYELSEINELCAKLEAQVNANAKPAAVIAQNLIDTQARIKAAGRRMQASLSELALVQATAMQADAVVEKAAGELVVAKENLAAGVEPIQGLSAEYEKQQRDRQRIAANIVSLKAKQRAQALANEQQMGRTRTTAVLRPKLYVPQGGTLDLPVPFGAWAPIHPPAQPNAARFYKPKATPGAGALIV